MNWKTERKEIKHRKGDKERWNGGVVGSEEEKVSFFHVTGIALVINTYDGCPLGFFVLRQDSKQVSRTSLLPFSFLFSCMEVVLTVFTTKPPSISWYGGVSCCEIYQIWGNPVGRRPVLFNVRDRPRWRVEEIADPYISVECVSLFQTAFFRSKRVSLLLRESIS